MLDQLAGVPQLEHKTMFGGIGLYSGEIFFAIVAADVAFFKVDDSNRATYEAIVDRTRCLGLGARRNPPRARDRFIVVQRRRSKVIVLRSQLRDATEEPAELVRAHLRIERPAVVG